jgi:hypothetical protein
MRKKVLDYLDKPNKKLWADLTSEEQRWIKRQGNDGSPATAPNKKPVK